MYKDTQRKANKTYQLQSQMFIPHVKQNARKEPEMYILIYSIYNINDRELRYRKRV